VDSRCYGDGHRFECEWCLEPSPSGFSSRIHVLLNHGMLGEDLLSPSALSRQQLITRHPGDNANRVTRILSFCIAKSSAESLLKVMQQAHV
jgi:hypothetical protein